MQNNILIIFLTIQDIIKKIIPLLNALFIVSYSHSHINQIVMAIVTCFM